MMSTAWVVPGIIGPSIAAVVGQAFGWRWVFLGLLPLLALAGGLALSALRNVPAAIPDRRRRGRGGDGPAAAERPARGRRCGILVAALTAQQPLLVVGGSALGLALLLPAFRRLTPAGTLVLAAGVPAAILLRGVMTFAFFAGDAYIPLLLQTWRGTSPTLTGIVFTVTTLAWTAGTWLQARRIDRLGTAAVHRARLRAASPSDPLLTLLAVLPGVPPEIAILTWIAARHRHGVHVLRRDARGPARRGRVGAGERHVVAAAVATSWGRPSGTGVGRRDHRVRQPGRGRRAGPGAGARSSRCRCVVARARALASRARRRPLAARRTPIAAAVD